MRVNGHILENYDYLLQNRLTSIEFLTMKNDDIITTNTYST